MPARFYNDPDETVEQMLEALARTRPLRVSEPGSGVRAVVRADLDPQQVAVVSGGGSGHEPSHAGLVGDGLLSAAVCGAFFASPSVEEVLTVIREVTGPGGCLLVVKNYTGDRLNFGLAAERARTEGLEVEVVTVADDVALPENPQPRGLAGTVLVHKVAGHHARNGADLATVAAAARQVSADLLTLSLSLSSALLPGQDGERRSAELGLGIHNEAGCARRGAGRRPRGRRPGARAVARRLRRAPRCRRLDGRPAQRHRWLLDPGAGRAGPRPARRPPEVGSPVSSARPH